ncbi:MAG: hypothetical protein MR033_07600 [Clostridiales bacterium]|nr:hypothetical protein [Clostridiales bacterium]
MKQAMGAILALTLFAGCFFCACDSGTRPSGTDQNNPPTTSQNDTNNQEIDKTDNKNDTGTDTGTVGQTADKNTAAPSRSAGRNDLFRYQGTRGRNDLTAGRYERQLDRVQRGLDNRNLMT